MDLVPPSMPFFQDVNLNRLSPVVVVSIKALDRLYSLHKLIPSFADVTSQSQRGSFANYIL